MRKTPNLLISAGIVVAALALGFFVSTRFSGPPLATQLLPEGDSIVYLKLGSLHLEDLSQSASVEPEGDYKEFVAQTGIQIERDLDEVAMSRRDTPDHRDVESSEILVGHFDAERLKTYLQKAAHDTQEYRDHTIYGIQHEGHFVRVCLLDAARVAVTNMDRSEPMHGIVDRSITRHAAGPSLLDAFYNRVPHGSLGWVIARGPNQDAWQLPGGFSLPADSIAVASLRYDSSLLFRAEISAQSETQAKQMVEDANSHLALVHSIGESLGARGQDKDLKAAFDSLRVEQKENVAVFTATIPQSLIKKIWSEVQNENAAPGAPAQKP